MGSSLFSTPSKKLKKMKCVAILLAIVVAVAAKDETAATSACPEIDQAKYVYVAEPRVNSCVYSNRLDVPKEWFTAKFYLDDGHIENVPKEGENQCDKALVADYTLKLGQAISEMESNYKCEYKCTFNTGCYSFNRSSYNRKCVTFPTPKKVSYKLVGVAPFKATWKGACQPDKKDCKAQTVDDYKTK